MSTSLSALASVTVWRKRAVRSLRKSLVRIAQGKVSLLSLLPVLCSSSQGMPAVLLSSSTRISVVPPKNGSISTGTSN